MFRSEYSFDLRHSTARQLKEYAKKDTTSRNRSIIRKRDALFCAVIVSIKKIYISPVAYSAIPVYNNRHYWCTSSYNRNV